MFGSLCCYRKLKQSKRKLSSVFPFLAFPFLISFVSFRSSVKLTLWWYMYQGYSSSKTRLALLGNTIRKEEETEKKIRVSFVVKCVDCSSDVSLTMAMLWHGREKMIFSKDTLESKLTWVLKIIDWFWQIHLIELNIPLHCQWRFLISNLNIFPSHVNVYNTLPSHTFFLVSCV